MKKNIAITIAAVLFTLSSQTARTVHADVKLPAVIGSDMVLQRDVSIPIWGWADAGEEVTVTLNGQAAATKADGEGRWKVKLPAMKADGKSHKLTVSGNNSIELTGILVGEVWVGSGQSNMEWRLVSTNGAKEAIAAAKHPQIRLFHVPKVQSKTPADDVKAAWQSCAPETAGSFSAVLYYFGLRLQKALGVPVGLINSSWGGSPIEPWTIDEEQSGRMYNGMIAPLQPYAIRGAIWYQGETNVIRKNGLKYRDKMEALIGGWRKSWNQDISFYFVQIAPFSGGGYQPGQLPALWEAQTASLKIPGTGMAVVTDLVDNIRDIHPRNKLDVGNRLALWALAKNYGKKDLVYSGPLYKSMQIKGKSIHLHFAHAGGGLKSRDGKPLSEFQVAGADGKFVAAKAEIEGNTVVVQAVGVDSPKHVRFGWHKAANPNLINKEGLPGSPFQTDGWSGGTGE